MEITRENIENLLTPGVQFVTRVIFAPPEAIYDAFLKEADQIEDGLSIIKETSLVITERQHAMHAIIWKDLRSPDGSVELKFSLAEKNYVNAAASIMSTMHSSAQRLVWADEACRNSLLAAMHNSEHTVEEYAFIHQTVSC